MGSRSVWTWSVGDSSSECAAGPKREEQGPVRAAAHGGVTQWLPVGPWAAAATLFQMFTDTAAIQETPSLLSRLTKVFIQ